jgi:GTP-binding protein
MLDDELMKAIKKELPKKYPHIFISSLTNKNMSELKDLLWNALNADSLTTA